MTVSGKARHRAYQMKGVPDDEREIVAEDIEEQDQIRKGKRKKRRINEEDDHEADEVDDDSNVDPSLIASRLQIENSVIGRIEEDMYDEQRKRRVDLSNLSTPSQSGKSSSKARKRFSTNK